MILRLLIAHNQFRFAALAGGDNSLRQSVGVEGPNTCAAAGLSSLTWQAACLWLVASAAVGPSDGTGANQQNVDALGGKF